MGLCVLLDFLGMFVDNVKHWLNSYVFSLQSDWRPKLWVKLLCVSTSFLLGPLITCFFIIFLFYLFVEWM
jgi:hypothetical protein